MSKAKIIFMGTPVFAVSALQALIDAGYQVVAVYTQAPKAKGRGHHVQSSPVHQLADLHSIPVFTPKSLRPAEEIALFESHDADLAVVAAYGLLLPLGILNAPRLGCINLHGSLLPRWRGAAPIHRALMAGDTETGITLMQMDVGLDTGAMLAKSYVPISEDTTLLELHDLLAQSGADLMIQNLESVLASALTAEPQPEDGVSYAHKLEKSEGLLNWDLSATELSTRIRALNPWPGSWFMFEDTPIKVLKAVVVSTSDGTLSDDDRARVQSAPVGTFFKTQTHEMCVISGDRSVLSLLELQRPGGKPLSVAAFLAGMNALREVFIK
jgi:methionyl-tRNA formyltransferase